MKKVLLCLLFVTIFIQTNFVHAQLPPGSTAPDWTLTDLDGNSHNLYDLLNQDKTVYLVFSATWCGPCWNFHNSGAFESIWNEHGPGGTNQAYTFFIEADYGTAESCLYGNCGNTLGDWTAGIPFPIINLTGSNGGNVAGAYQISYFPTIYAVCPDRRIYETGQAPASTLETYMNSCSMMETSVVTTEEDCYEDGNGAIDIEVQGGTGSISYLWSNGASTQDINGITAGDYRVTMTDGNSVSYSTTIELDGPTQSLGIDNNNGILELDCYGDETAFLSVAAYGGISPYSALWNDGNTSFVRPNLGGGTYSITVSDANGCTNEESYTVTEPPELQLSLDKLDETCSQANGFIASSSSGGTGLHTYSFGQGSTNSPNFPNLSEGVYDVTVTDENSCQSTESIELFNIPGPEAIAPSSVQMECEGTSLVIDATSSTITSGASISWSTADGHIVSDGNTLMPVVDASGTYTLLISDPSTCDDETTVVVEPSPEQPTADAGPDQEVNCSNPSTTIGSDNSTSGNHITYSWLNENGDEIGNTLLLEVQQAGTYTLIVTNTQINCSSTSLVEVNNTGGSVVAEAEVQGSIDCNQTSVILNGEGSTSGDNIIYTWLDAEGNQIGNELELEVNEPGNYTLQVTDTTENCTIENTISVPDNRIDPEFEIEGSNELTCADEVVTLEGIVSNLDSNFTATWMNEAGDELSSGLILEVANAGSYTLKIQNLVTGCESEKVFTVNENILLPTIVIQEPNNLSCLVTEVVIDGSNSSTGSQFEYVWMDEDGNVINSADGPQLTVTEPGIYILQITNTENGCMSISSIEVMGYDDVPSAGIIFDPQSLDVHLNADVEGVYEEVIWDFGDGNTSTSLETDHTYAHRGTYEICLTLINDCGETRICRSVFVNYGLPSPYEEKKVEIIDDDIGSDPNPFTGVGNASLRSFGNKNELQIQVGPNPYNDHFLIEWNNSTGEFVELKVTDLNGSIIYSRSIEDLGSHSLKVNTYDWSSGLYVLHWMGQNEHHCFKLIKQ